MGGCGPAHPTLPQAAGLGPSCLHHFSQDEAAAATNEAQGQQAPLRKAR